MSNTLRTGFTTGTCAAAGAKAGVLAIKEQKNIDTVDVLLPRGTFAKIQIIKFTFDFQSFANVPRGNKTSTVSMFFCSLMASTPALAPAAAHVPVVNPVRSVLLTQPHVFDCINTIL